MVKKKGELLSQDFNDCPSPMILSPRRRRLSVEALARILAAREWMDARGLRHARKKEGTLFFCHVRVLAVFDLKFLI